MNSAPSRERKTSALRDFVSNRLEELRITMAEAERRGELHKGFIGDLLRGIKAGLQAHNITSLARALDVRPEEIASVMVGGAAIGDDRNASINELPVTPDSLGAASGRIESNDVSNPIPIELAIGQELKVHAVVDRAILTAMLDILVQGRR